MKRYYLKSFSEQPKGKLCHEGLPRVCLLQNGKDSFTVKYGLQVKTGLTYGQAAVEYGACLMHALACDGLLDNRMKGER
jgi:hypothetical protein